MNDAAALALLQRIADTLDALLAAQTAPKAAALRRVDRDRLARLLPAIAGAIGSETFTVAELLEERAVRLVVNGLDARSVGRLLHRATNLPIDGYLVERVGAELHRALWRVVQTP